MTASKPKILIIDDDRFLTGIFVPSLKKKGLAVAVANDPLSGLELVKRDPPDLILLDIVMPGMDGYAVLRELKSDAATASIPVVMLSNLTQPEDIERAMAAGASGFLKKQESLPSAVAEKVRQLVKRANPKKI